MGVSQGFGPADWITSFRAGLVLVLAAVLLRRSLPDPLFCVAVAGTAAALDGVDGWIARRTRTSSAFGARFDMETDALLILVLAALVWSYGKAGGWILAAGLMRYLFVAGGALWPWLQRPLEPSRRRQAVCVVQIVTLIGALVPAIAPPASGLVAAAGLAALGWSFLVDILWLWRWRALPALYSSSTPR